MIPATPWRSQVIVLVSSVVTGAALFSFGIAPHLLFFYPAAVIALVFLLLYPEFALVLYVVVGDVKGDDRVAALLPFDLTLALGAILLAGIALNFLRGRRVVSMPASYFLFIALVAWMAASLSYTPVLVTGVEKLARFLTVTGIVIAAPFFVLISPHAMKRFLVGFAAAAFAICGWSLLNLGGSERLATPSDNTIGLGHIACALILLIWFAVVPRCKFPLRFPAYALLAVPAIALVGSGSRGSAVACAIVILLSLFFYPRLWLDLGILVGLGIAALPFLSIPDSAVNYLGTLFEGQSVGSILNFRSDLLVSAWKLVEQHPLLGVGLQGFRYRSQNPALYNWPHNIFLEIACELGIPAALLALAIFGSAIREAVRQLRNRNSPDFLLSQLTAALLMIGIVNALNTGDINSDRSTWLFVSLVFIVRGFQTVRQEQHVLAATAAHPLPA